MKNSHKLYKTNFIFNCDKNNCPNNSLSNFKGELEIYNSNNPIIKTLSNRFINKIEIILKNIKAYSSVGLDVGCGEGNLLNNLYYKQALKNIVAVDTNETRLKYALINHPICSYLKQDICHLGFRSNTFDYIIATEIFEHLPDPTLAMEELKRVAKIGGRLIISVPYEPFFHWGNLLRGKHLKNYGKTPDHLNFWNKTEFQKFLGYYVKITQKFSASTFPWLVYNGKFRKS